MNIKTNLATNISIPTDVADVLSVKDMALYLSVIEKWKDRYCGSLKYKFASFSTMYGYVNRLTLFLGKPFWEWETGDLDRWFGHLGRIDALAVSTQRIVQSNIASLFDFVSEVSIANEVERLTGIRLRQICTKDIRIPHKNVREGKRARQSFTQAHLDLFFDTIDIGIEDAERFHSKEFRTRQRDKAFLFLVYDLGLRRFEGCNLTTRSYEPRVDRPELGEFAVWHVFGKGDKYRSVKTVDPLLTDVMNWYVNDIRPHFLSIKTTNVDALFISERGNPLSDDQLDRAFKTIIEEAGLTPYGYTLHCLRHSYVTDAEQVIGLDAVQQQVGHVFRATTEGYYHTDPTSVSNQINAGIDRTINMRNTKK